MFHSMVFFFLFFWWIVNYCACTDPALPVRRYGTAGLGELLFYITTNTSTTTSNDRSASQFESTQWKITASELLQLCKCLRPDEDDIVRYCSVKTYENVLSTTPDPPAARSKNGMQRRQSGRGRIDTREAPGFRFATHEVAMHLLNIAVRGRGSVGGVTTGATSSGTGGGVFAVDELRGAAAMALGHLVRLNRKLLPRLAEKEGWNFLVGGLLSGPPRGMVLVFVFILFPFFIFVMVWSCVLVQCNKGFSTC